VGSRMTRRQVAKTGLASLVAPAIARAQGTRTLKFVPRTALASLDPVWTTDAATRALALISVRIALQR
jgi:peptide/nickel transport system substrate-binding protein